MGGGRGGLQRNVALPEGAEEACASPRPGHASITAAATMAIIDRLDIGPPSARGAAVQARSDHARTRLPQGPDPGADQGGSATGEDGPRPRPRDVEGFGSAG